MVVWPSTPESSLGPAPPSRRRVLVAGTGVATAGLAGCTSVFDREKTITYEFSNADGVPYDVELFVLAADSNEIEVRFENGEPWRGAVTDTSLNQLFDTTEPVSGVDPLGDPINTASFQVSPGAGTGASFPPVPRDAGLLAVTTRIETETVGAHGSWLCSPSVTLRDLRVQFRPDVERSVEATCS